MAKFELVNHGINTKSSIKIIMLQHRINMQQGIAAAMTWTRVRAAEHIIPNKTSFVNPYMARKFQPSTPGRLTSRTGKLRFMVSHFADMKNPYRHWSGTWGKTLVKERSVALIGQIRAQKLTNVTERYIGTYRVNIQSHPRLFDTKRKKPQETLRTLAVRFNWETGIRGDVRPIFKPVVHLTDFDMRREVERKNNRLGRII